MAKKIGIRIGIVLVIVCLMGFSDWSFAAGLDDIHVFGFTLNYLVSALAWLRVFFANIAGEFLTNKWVYGEFLGLDILLWRYWNIVKNFANFGLGVYFVYIVFKGLISSGKDSVGQTLKNNLLWLVIAGIGIQASRFLTAFFIDLSSITMAAVGSLPASALSESIYVEDTLKNKIQDSFYWSENNVTEMSLFKDSNRVSQFLKVESGYVKMDEKTMTLTGLLDEILPKSQNVSGPLYFIGFSILNTTNIPTINNTNIKSTIYNTIIQGGTTILYAIEILILCIIALIRILYLWMFIIMSPFAILLWCIQKSGEKIFGDSDSLKGIVKVLKFETFFINVFKPTIIILGLGMAVIFTSLMSGIISKSANSGNGTFSYGGVTFSSIKDPTSLGQTAGDDTYTTTMNHSLFNFTLAHTGKTLIELILSVLTVFLVYHIIKLSMEIGNQDDFLGKSIKSLQKGLGDILTKTPVIPVAGYDEKGIKTTQHLSIGKTLGLGNDKGNSIITEKIRSYQGNIDELNSEDNQLINSWFGNDTGYLSAEEKQRITKARENNLNNGIEALKAMKQEIPKVDKGKGMTLNPETSSNNGFWIEEFSAWLEGMEKKRVTGTGKYNDVWNEMINRWNNEGNKDAHTLQEKSEKLQTMFGSVSNSAMAYAQYFFDSDDERANITSWDKLKNADISKK